MAIYTTMEHVHQSRTLKPRYARTQATAQAVKLDPKYDVSTGDIFPGTVMERIGNDKVRPLTSTGTPAGLSGNWCAPVFGIDEVRNDGNFDMSLWVLGNDAVFAISKPAFDTKADWTTAKTTLGTGAAVYLAADAKGLLTIEKTTGENPAPVTAPTAKTVAKLIDVESDGTIVIAGL